MIPTIVIARPTSFHKHSSQGTPARQPGTTAIIRCRSRLRWTVGFIGLALLFWAIDPAAGRAADEATKDSAHEKQWVEIATNAGRPLRALVALPQSRHRARAVVIVHENRGLTPWECDLAGELADAGWVAVAPDLLSGAGPDGGGTDSFGSTAAAHDALATLPADQVADDLDAAVEYARGLLTAEKTVSVAGFSWGGGQAFLCAARNSEIAAAMVFYGAAPNEEQMRAIEVPVYGFYAENDRIAAAVPAIKAKMKELGKRFDAVTYLGAGHGFMRVGEAKDAKPADQRARADAWARWQLLLDKP
ncbi:MAG: dienelactone hydrolase family protein [Planctomycetia bacterium]|nr:dienelactone hydrolase family protein [Planctomycetia bacterium]